MDGRVGRVGILEALPGPQVVSLSPSGQTGKCCCGGTTVAQPKDLLGEQLEVAPLDPGVQHAGVFIKSISSSVSACSFTNTTPGLEESQRSGGTSLYTSLF